MGRGGGRKGKKEMINYILIKNYIKFKKRAGSAFHEHRLGLK